MSFPDKPSFFEFGKLFHNPPISLRPLHRKSNDKMRGKLFARLLKFTGLICTKINPQGEQACTLNQPKRRADPRPNEPPGWTVPSPGTILNARRSTSRTTPVWMIIHGGHPNL